jgi:ParB family chromosome partitioning protein
MQDTITIEDRSGKLMSIALSLLVPSPQNVRKTNGTDVSALKASIEAQGLLHNLIVVPVKARRGRVQRYEVVGGKRRLAALRALARAARRIRGVSKAELARLAERELQDKRWLPVPLRAEAASPSVS